MHRSAAIKTVQLILEVVVFQGIALCIPVSSQIDNNFLDLNQSQSNQFFNQGNEQLEAEIEQFTNNDKLPEINLPETYQKPEDLNNQSYIYKQQKLQVLNSQVNPERLRD